MMKNKSKEVQKRWRSIRDSYTKTYRQGKCMPPEQCPPNSRRYQYHRQMSFLLRALQNKKPRYSQDKYESYSEVSNSPQHPPPEDIMPKIKTEAPLDLKTTPTPPEKPETVDKCNQATIDKNPSLEIKIDANSILPDDHFDDDRLFMNSLIPFFKRMDDDTRLLCRIEVLKITRYALQGHKCIEALKVAEDSYFKDRMSGILAKQEVTDTSSSPKSTESKLSMTTRSADGSRPMRKKRMRSPSPLPVPAKRRGPGRPRKIRPPPSDSDEEQLSKKRCPRLKVAPVPAQHMSEMDESLSRATSVAQLSTPLFMKMYNLERTKVAPAPSAQTMQLSIKTEPIDEDIPPETS
ncbi:bromodomain-containing protein 4 isoform X2 [Manduca sexta]|uniref:bromodomain-containing protein 4 isoform X2 n=1 Tax=Manduca sexta TaxID=7130 RepID=UPI0018901634|nr:bromodomain-containing protein 4 isoform X2 [Manduca sexta]